MFDTRKTFSGRLADAVDLMIDFATLGEYGLEPVEAPQGCEARRRPRTSTAARRAPRRALLK
jgi:hypothetical protein